MIPSFQQVMEFTRTISSHAAFEDDECLAYFDLLTSLPTRSTILEIGLQFGRSSSIALQVTKERQLKYFGVDPFTDPPEALGRWTEMAQKIGAPYSLLHMTSEQASRHGNICPDLILIDGDHTKQGVQTDLQCWADSVSLGGYVCFHDYGRDSLPDIYPTVQTFFTSQPSWKEIGIVGTLGVWQFKD